MNAVSNPLHQNVDFRLPPNITVKRQARPQWRGVCISRRGFRRTGRLVVEGTPSGQKRLTSKVAGDSNNLMLQRRIDMLSLPFVSNSNVYSAEILMHATLATLHSLNIIQKRWARCHVKRCGTILVDVRITPCG